MPSDQEAVSLYCSCICPSLIAIDECIHLEFSALFSFILIVSLCKDTSSWSILYPLSQAIRKLVLDRVVTVGKYWPLLVYVFTEFLHRIMSRQRGISDNIFQKGYLLVHYSTIPQ